MTNLLDDLFMFITEHILILPLWLGMVEPRSVCGHWSPHNSIGLVVHISIRSFYLPICIQIHSIRRVCCPHSALNRGVLGGYQIWNFLVPQAGGHREHLPYILNSFFSHFIPTLVSHMLSLNRLLKISI